jgi:Fic family protein
LVFSAAAGAALHTATRALVQLERDPIAPLRLATIAPNLLRSESVASSRIEGVEISQKRLARVTFEGTERRRADNRAAEVLGNVEAMQLAIGGGERGERFAVEDILAIHRTLLRNTADREIAGVVRASQNWIGGNDRNPVGATYVPPPPERVPALLDDLCEFLARDDLPPVAQAAIAHAQFENIHPFADGNGRTGRALVYAVLRRTGEIGACVPPISLILASEPRRYVAGFGSYSAGDVSAWCAFFAEAAARAAEAAWHFARGIEDRQREWLARAGEPRRDSTARRLIELLPEQPVIDVATAQRLTGRSHVAVGAAIDRLARARILTPLNERKWGRAWECEELLELVEDFEREVSTS